MDIETRTIETWIKDMDQEPHHIPVLSLTDTGTDRAGSIVLLMAQVKVQLSQEVSQEVSEVGDAARCQNERKDGKGP